MLKMNQCDEIGDDNLLQGNWTQQILNKKDRSTLIQADVQETGTYPEDLSLLWTNFNSSYVMPNILPKPPYAIYLMSLQNTIYIPTH